MVASCWGLDFVAEMGTERRQLKVMLWKNWLLKVRHPFVTCAEILLPTVVMMLLIDVRMRVHTQIHAAQPYIRNGVFVEVSKGISPNFEKVLELLLNQEEFLAFAPDTEETRSMINIMSVKFPLLKCVSRVCKDEQELETYIHSDLYGTANQIPNCSNPKIRGAVVFHDQGPQSFDYSIRLNHTWAFSGFPDVKSIMDVNGPYLNDLELGVNAVPTMQYSSGGFVTLLQVLDLFIIFAAQQSDTKDIELPSSATLSSGEPSFLSVPWMLYGPSNIRIVPFPSREYTDDEFQSIIKAVMRVLYLLGSLYPISRLISYLVFEKDLDAFSAAVIVSIAFSFIPSSFAVPIVKEREVKAKHQQLISGVSVLSSSVFYSFMLGFYFHMGLHQLPFSLIVCNNSFLHLWSGAVHWKRIFIVNSYHVFNVWISNCIIHILPYNFLL